jgi:metallophosphoesterase superfamily enzyme
MLPVAPPDATVDRLAALQAEYRPRQIVFLGDLVHAALGLEPLQALLLELVEKLGGGSQLTCLLGNHDRHLPQRLVEWSLPIGVHTQLWVGRFHLAHGDVVPPPGDSSACPVGEEPVWVVGHEHPCVILGDGGISALRVPCFLEAPRCILLPAFSAWASGCVVGQRPFSGPIAAGQRFDRVLACVGERLLAIPREKLRL